MKTYVVHWRYCDKSGNGIVGVFDEEEIANAVFDALEATGDTSRSFYIDTYIINQVKK